MKMLVFENKNINKGLLSLSRGLVAYFWFHSHHLALLLLFVLHLSSLTSKKDNIPYENSMLINTNILADSLGILLLLRYVKLLEIGLKNWIAGNVFVFPFVLHAYLLHQSNLMEKWASLWGYVCIAEREICWFHCVFL